MARSLDERLTELIVNLVGQEARRIECDRKEIKRYKPNNPKPVFPDILNKTKRDIYKLFNEDYDEEIVRKKMIEYLNWQTEFVDKDVNPSYHILKEIIERGEYDFDFRRYAEG